MSAAASTFGMLTLVRSFRNYATACQREGDTAEAERYKRKAQDWLRLVRGRPCAELPDRQED